MQIYWSKKLVTVTTYNGYTIGATSLNRYIIIPTNFYTRVIPISLNPCVIEFTAPSIGKLPFITSQKPLPIRISSAALLYSIVAFSSRTLKLWKKRTSPIRKMTINCIIWKLHIIVQVDISGNDFHVDFTKLHFARVIFGCTINNYETIIKVNIVVVKAIYYVTGGIFFQKAIVVFMLKSTDFIKLVDREAFAVLPVVTTAPTTVILEVEFCIFNSFAE